MSGGGMVRDGTAGKNPSRNARGRDQWFPARGNNGTAAPQDRGITLNEPTPRRQSPQGEGGGGARMTYGDYDPGGIAFFSVQNGGRVALRAGWAAVMLLPCLVSLALMLRAV